MEVESLMMIDFPFLMAEALFGEGNSSLRRNFQEFNGDIEEIDFLSNAGESLMAFTSVVSPFLLFGFHLHKSPIYNIDESLMFFLLELFFYLSVVSL